MKEELENSQKPLFVYCEVEKSGHTIDDYYDSIKHGFEDLEDEVFVDTQNLTKEDFIKKYENSQEFEDWCESNWEDMYEELYNNVTEECDKLLSKKAYTKVDGFQQRWNGKYSGVTIIPENSIKDIIKNYMRLDILTLEVYEDSIKLINRHHDGTNIYSFYPFEFNDLKIVELKELINKNYFEEYTDKKLSNALKEDMINFLNETYFEK